MFEDIVPALRNLVPDLRGTLEANAPGAPLSWFRTGGPVQVLYTPADEDDLSTFLTAIPADITVLMLGIGSNILIRDNGVPGIVIRLGKTLSEVTVEADCKVRAGAGAPDVKVARVAGDAGIAGLAFLRGIPGSIGGAMRMNCGSYGSEVKDVLVSVRAVHRSGRKLTLSNADMGFTYRNCAVPSDVYFTEALFHGRPGVVEEIQAEMNKITEARSSTQPVNSRTGGSTFKNPPDGKSWQLIEAVGCRGLRVGDAQVSEMHCNFLINNGAASAADIENLGEEVRRRVLEKTGVPLEWEIKRIGIKAGRPQVGVTAAALTSK